MRHFFLFTMILLPFLSYGQLQESFDGMNVTDTYPWQGNTDRFIINSANELQLNGRLFTDEVKLFLSSVSLLDNEWSGKARSEYKGTTGNYFRFFLWCEKPDLNNPGHAIYVRMGYSKNNIALCYQRGNIAKEVLIEGRTLFKDAQEVEFKAVTDPEGICTLYSRCTGETEFYEEGTARIPVYGTEGYFMIGIKHSKDHRKNKFIDDLYIKKFVLAEEPGDEEEKPALALEDAEEENGKELLCYFNREVIAEEATVTLSELGEIQEIYQSEDDKILKFVWEKSRVKGKEYTLSYSGIYDTDGNECKGKYTFTSRYGTKEEPKEPEKPEGSTPGAIRINEIMANPKGAAALPETEYVELYNTLEETISLEGWVFMYGESKITLPAYELSPETYLLLYREGREVLLEPRGEEMPLAKFPSQLANTGKKIQLFDPAGNVIDAVTYGSGKAGKSWEWSAEGWFPSTDSRGGTPGGKNSPYSSGAEEPEKPDDPKDPETPEMPEGEEVEPFDIVFNELLPNPYPEGSEYIELYNRSERTLPLHSLSVAVRKASGELSTRYKLTEITTPLAPGEYILLTKDEEGVTPYYSILYPGNIRTIKLPILNNNGATVVLFRTADEEVIDELTYSSKWHHSAIRAEKGVALERIDPDGETQDAANWTSAAESAGFGTPGYQNSQYLRFGEENEGTSIEKPFYSHQSGLYSILYALDQPGYNCRAYVYNLSGQRVAEIANNELAGTRGEFLWNGFGNGNRKLSPGPYIFYLELYHSKGLVKTYKEVFLVH